MNTDASDHRRSLLASWAPICGGVALAMAVGLLLHYADARTGVLAVLAWMEGLGAWGPIFFILLQTVFVVLILPGIVMTLGAGFLFGPIFGTMYVSIGNIIGASTAFLIARTCLGARAARFLKSRQSLRDLDRRLSQTGWQTILLTRMIPFFPFKLSNYAFGVMGFRFRDFVVGTLIGCLPITITNVYAGSLAADLATMTPGGAGPGLWWLYGLGLLALLALLYLLAQTAWRRLSTQDDTPSGEKPKP